MSLSLFAGSVFSFPWSGFFKLSPTPSNFPAGPPASPPIPWRKEEPWTSSHHTYQQTCVCISPFCRLAFHNAEGPGPSLSHLCWDFTSLCIPAFFSSLIFPGLLAPSIQNKNIPKALSSEKKEGLLPPPWRFSPSSHSSSFSSGALPTSAVSIPSYLLLLSLLQPSFYFTSPQNSSCWAHHRCGANFLYSPFNWPIL